MAGMIAKVFLSLLMFTSLAQATPAGLATVMSIYRDRQSAQQVIVRGYGVVVEINVIMPDHSTQRQYVIQTVSHLSQGGLDPGSFAYPLPASQRRTTPRLLVDLAVDNGNTRVFAHLSRQEPDPLFREIIQQTKTLPLIGSSFSESFRDRDLLVLAPGALPHRQIPAAVSLTYHYPSNKNPEIRFATLKLDDDWQMSHANGGIAIACPKSYPACAPEHLVSLSSDSKSPAAHTLSQRLIGLGAVNALYDSWLPFATNPGMSGLPVFRTDFMGRVVEILGLISGSSPLSHDTWLAKFEPMEMFAQFASEVNAAAARKEDPEIFLSEHFIWMMDRFSLTRVGQNGNFALLEAGFLDAGQAGSAPLRCSQGSGFRMDNGSGFRLDNGDLMCGGNFHHGQDFSTQLRGGQQELTAFMIVDNRLLTSFYPPTATGFGSYFELNNWQQSQKPYRLLEADQMQFGILSLNGKDQASLAVTQSMFTRFASPLYVFDTKAQSWSAKLRVTMLDKADPSRISVREDVSNLTLIPTFVSGVLSSVDVRIEGDLSGPLHKVIDYQHLRSDDSIFRLQQKVQTQSGEGILSLEGLLTSNPDFIRTPELTVQFPAEKQQGETPVMQLVISESDPEIKTLFLFTRGTKVFYFSVQKSDN